jgi:hypothetical protein
MAYKIRYDADDDVLTIIIKEKVSFLMLKS